MSTLNVEGIKNTAATSDAITFATDGTCTAKVTNNLSNRNLIINGDFNIAQRGTSSGSSGYKTVDRWQMSAGGANAALTQTQHTLTSSDTGPWAKGFRKSFHILNAGQSGPDAGDYLELYTYLEDQNISQSGWDYASSSSYLTISFWVKSSVAQKFYGFLYTNQAGQGDSKMYSYVIDNGSGGNLSADTWTKITHKIPGNSSLTFNNDNTNGLAVGIFPFDGTDYTTSGHTLNTWASWNSNNKLPDNTSTWWTTSNATFEITGVQLEVGDVATDFEHRSYGDELARCQRYYEVLYMSAGTACCYSTGDSTIKYAHTWYFKHEKRAQASVALLDDAAFSASGGGTVTMTGIFTSKDHCMFYYSGGMFRLGDNDQHAAVKAESEL